jgi:hypothetical protein
MRPMEFRFDQIYLKASRMPRIVLLLEDCGPQKAKVVAEIRQKFGLAVAEIMSAIGGVRALFDRPMFSRTDPDWERRLSEMMTNLDQLGATYTAYEVLDGQNFLPEARDSYFRITRDRLVNIISAHDRSLREVRDLPEQD